MVEVLSSFNYQWFHVLLLYTNVTDSRSLKEDFIEKEKKGLQCKWRRGQEVFPKENKWKKHASVSEAPPANPQELTLCEPKDKQ